MLRKIRITAAAVCCMLITLLFLDFTGTLHAWFGFLAKIQFLPALLALNFGVVAALIVLTLLFGRVYCSVICPLGVMQDAVSWIAGKRTKNRFRYSPALSWLRYGVLALFIAAAVAGIGSFVALLAPYSAYGRIVSNLIAPLYLWGNNLLAYLAERAGSYAFYRADVWMKGIATLAVAAGTFIILAVVAWRNGRTYCNTICPVGTVLGLFSRFSLLAPVIDTCKCNGCGLCARNCKASCIDPKAHRIDLSRCVACMDCIGKCRQQAIHYRLRTGNAPFRAHPVEPPQQPAKKQIQAETDTTSSPIPEQKTTICLTRRGSRTRSTLSNLCARASTRRCRSKSDTAHARSATSVTSHTNWGAPSNGTPSSRNSWTTRTQPHCCITPTATAIRWKADIRTAAADSRHSSRDTLPPGVFRSPTRKNRYYANRRHLTSASCLFLHSSIT